MKLSIIIPIYNNFDKLKTCLKSLKKQTIFELFDVEIILVDDGSFCHPEFISGSNKILKHPPDCSSQERAGVKDDKGTSNIFLNLFQNQDDIHKYTIKHSGASAARNFGYSKSCGDYIFFCDADVIFLKNNALELMIKKLENNLNKAYCYSSFKYGWKKFKCGEFDKNKLKNNNYISTMSMIRRKALEKVIQTDKVGKNNPFDESLKKFQDWDLWLIMLENNLTGIWINKVLWKVSAKGAISSWLPKIFYKIFRNTKKIKEFEKAREIILQKYRLIG